MYQVYLYTNKINGKKYCGITNRTLHRRSEGNGMGYIRTRYKTKTKFANAILKYGWENFIPEVLYQVETKEEACELEIKTIKELDLTNDEFGYNLHFGGNMVNSEYCSRKGKDNGMYGNGHKLKGGKNGRATKVLLKYPNGVEKYFNTQKEAREFLNISKDMFYSLRDYNGKFKFSKMTNKSKIEKNKHIENIEVILI